MYLQENPSAVDSSQSGYTPDWLRSFKGCSHYNNEQAIEIINGLTTLAKILATNISKINTNN